MIEYSITDKHIKLDLPSGIFHPTTTTQLLAEQLVNLKDKIVLDLGCGAGPLAITAALNGAEKVYAVDIMEEACEATKFNAKLNGVDDCIEVRQGDLFKPVKGLKFDIILDDVSGMADEVSRISSWYPESIPTGGPDGTNQTIRMLRQSPNYLVNSGSLYFPLISLANSEKMLATAHEIFGTNIQRIACKFIPFNKELQANIHLLMRLKNEGTVNFTQRRGRYLWNLAIYKANA
ncbi:MAG: 50S ribosomal protein L11 methyltransferase [Candidatus Latescibacteria bacterium]|nr:50S ribosomal protein L11 methyltransferase [Candidatus Latescibacterota bacterium]